MFIPFKHLRNKCSWYSSVCSQYYGISGHGSFLDRNGRVDSLPLSPPRPLKSLSDALIAVEWGAERGMPIMQKRTDSFTKLAGDPSEIPGGKMAHAMRSVGSAALNFALVASGRLDLYWCVTVLRISFWQLNVLKGDWLMVSLMLNLFIFSFFFYFRPWDVCVGIIFPCNCNAHQL